VRHYPPIVENHWFVGGAVPANGALDLVRGKWIARVDDDDTWTPDHLEVLLHFAQAGNHEFVSGVYVEERFGKRTMIGGARAQDPYYTRRAPKREDTSPKIGGVSTWLYRSYLRFMKYNVNCWRKSWNRVWDADLSVRIFHAGVRMGFVDQVVAYVLPRPGEATVGLDAYRQAETGEARAVQVLKY
jgi:glycosyltransferase involved in cell wall biosynthesis